MIFIIDPAHPHITAAMKHLLWLSSLKNNRAGSIIIAIQIDEMHPAFRPAGGLRPSNFAPGEIVLAPSLGLALAKLRLGPAFGCPNSLRANLSRGRRRNFGARPEPNGRKSRKHRLPRRCFSGASTKTGRRDSGLSEGRDSRETPLMCQAITGLLWPFSGTF